MFKKTPPPMTSVMLINMRLALCRQMTNTNHWSNYEQTTHRRGAGMLGK